MPAGQALKYGLLVYAATHTHTHTHTHKLIMYEATHTHKHKHTHTSGQALKYGQSITG